MGFARRPGDSDLLDKAMHATGLFMPGMNGRCFGGPLRLKRPNEAGVDAIRRAEEGHPARGEISNRLWSCGGSMVV